MRWLYVLLAFLLTTSLLCVHSLEPHPQRHRPAVVSKSLPQEQHVLLKVSQYYAKEYLQALEKVRLYAFCGKGDDVKESQWPQLRPGWRTISSVILTFLGASICSAGGVGGGGLFIPVFNLLLQFDAKTSAALSNFVVVGGSLANLIWNFPQRHPSLTHKPVIDYDVALILQPNMLLGISLGVICNVMFPGWLIIAQLAVILGYITTRSFKNATKRWRIESILANAEELDTSGDGIERGQPVQSNKKASISVSAEEAKEGAVEPWQWDMNYQIRDINSGESQLCFEQKDDSNGLHSPLLMESSRNSTALSRCNMRKFICLALVWLAFFAIQLLRGSKTTKGILPLKTCGLGYWLLTGSQVPLACIVTVWTASGHPKTCSSVAQEAGDVTRSRALTVFPAMALISGFFGGMLGIGGGMIINPMLIEVGMHPQVTAATSTFMILFSSSMSVVEFWLLGRIPMDFALLFTALCFVASLIGLGAVHHAIAKYNRASLIVFSVAIVMGISACLMAGFGSINVWKQYISGAYMGFHSPCTS